MVSSQRYGSVLPLSLLLFLNTCIVPVASSPARNNNALRRNTEVLEARATTCYIDTDTCYTDQFCCGYLCCDTETEYCADPTSSTPYCMENSLSSALDALTATTGFADATATPEPTATDDGFDNFTTTPVPTATSTSDSSDFSSNSGSDSSSSNSGLHSGGSSESDSSHTQTHTTTGKKKGMTLGAKIGAILGPILGVMAIAGATVLGFCLKKKNKNKKLAPQQPAGMVQMQAPGYPPGQQPPAPAYTPGENGAYAENYGTVKQEAGVYVEPVQTPMSPPPQPLYNENTGSYINTEQQPVFEAPAVRNDGNAHA